MPDFVLCPMALYPRGPSGLMRYLPKVHLYAHTFSQQTRSDPATGVPLRNWSLVRVDTWIDLAEAQSDPDIVFLPDGMLDTQLGNRANTIETTINSRFGIALALKPSTTVRETIRTVGLLLDDQFNEPGFTS